MTEDSTHNGKGKIHAGADHSSPYPVSRLAPAMGLVDLAAEIEKANQMLSARTNAKLRVIADQMRALQKEARTILEEAQRDSDLNHARCGFKKVPGRIYHLYREAGGNLGFSMLSPEDWGGKPPNAYLGAYRLEADLSWSPADADAPPDDSRDLVRQLLLDSRDT